MKRLRRKTGHRFRFYMCGEYGEDFHRPHYHAIFFGHDFEDQKLFKLSKSGEPLYISKTLTETWGLGHAYIGTVTFQSAAYVARYVMKKVNGPQAENHYDPHDKETGETRFSKPLEPEYNTMSNQPGIGKSWFDKYYSEVYPSDTIVLNGHHSKPPKYYDKLYERIDPDGFKKIQRKRIHALLDNASNSTPKRLRIREAVLGHKLKRLKRGLEHPE